MYLSIEEKVKLLGMGIKALILFGSQAQNISNKNSDYDIFVIGKKSNEVYDFIYDLVSQKINKLINIDIVFDIDATMELKNHVITFGKVLFQEDESTFPNLKQQVMINYQDFAPYRQMFQNATLARIN